jgi:adenine-specific DNA methylase
MFALILMVIVCALLACCTIYAAIQAVKTDMLLRKANKRYDKDRQQLLKEITTNLNDITDDNNSKKSSDAISALKEIARYIKNQ